MPELFDHLTAYVTATIMAVATIVAAFISARRGTTPLGQGVDLVTRVASVIAAGGVVTLLSITVYVSILQLSLDERVQSSIATFEDLPHTPVSIGRAISDADREASAILGGDGPKQWETSTQIHNVGDVRYISGWKWVKIVIPDSSSNRTEEEGCALDTGGQLKIVGFSVDRNAALVSYKSPNPPGGNECNTGKYLFYPVPRRTRR